MYICAMSAEPSIFEAPLNTQMSGFQNYLENSLRDPFVLNLEGCSLQEVILACAKAKTRLHPNYRENINCLLYNLQTLEHDYRVTLQPIQVTDIFWGYFISFCQGRGLKNSTIGTMCNQLRSILNWAVKYNAKVSPTYADIKIPKARNQEIALSADDVSRITYFDVQRFYANKRRDFRDPSPEILCPAVKYSNSGMLKTFGRISKSKLFCKLWADAGISPCILSVLRYCKLKCPHHITYHIFETLRGSISPSFF